VDKANSRVSWLYRGHFLLYNGQQFRQGLVWASQVVPAFADRYENRNQNREEKGHEAYRGILAKEGNRCAQDVPTPQHRGAGGSI